MASSKVGNSSLRIQQTPAGIDKVPVYSFLNQGLNFSSICPNELGPANPISISDDFEICLMKLESENNALSSLLIGYLQGDKIQGELPSYLNLKCV